MLVVGRSDGEVGNGTQGGEVESAVMRRSVLAHQTGTVEAQHNWQIEQGGIVDHIVVSTLRKGRIYVTERNGPLLSHTGGEGNGMTLGNANVDKL